MDSMLSLGMVWDLPPATQSVLREGLAWRDPLVGGWEWVNPRDEPQEAQQKTRKSAKTLKHSQIYHTFL